MHLEKMVFVGFKSFAERTEVEFRKRLTAVVGPNGCGKSNIVDAFRWALGEQSVKSLRGSTMSDVIFKGTDSRPPAGYAEVTLQINAPELAPKLGGERRLIIQRRLYRSGVSEYILNGRIVRLKEIKYLLADTGIGATYYSVIDQQNVDAVLKVDAVKRRELLEEAAGVRGYRMQRDSAVSELKRAEAHLNNITEKVEELRQHKRRLSRQAAKAHKHRCLKEKLQQLRLNLFLLRRQKIEGELADIRPELEKLRMRLNELRTSYQTLSAELHQKQKEKRGLERLYADGEKEREALSEKVKECEINIAALRAKLGAYENEIERLRLQITSERSKIEEYGLKLREKENELKSIRRKYAETEKKLTGLHLMLDELRCQVQELEKRREELLKTKESLMEEAVRVRNRVADAKRQIEVIEREKRHLERERKDTTSALTLLVRKLERFKEHLMVMEKKKSEIHRKMVKQKQLTESLRRRIENIRRRIERISEESIHLRVDKEALEKILSERIAQEGAHTVVEAIRESGHRIWRLVDTVECAPSIASSMSLLLEPLERTFVVEDDRAIHSLLKRREKLPQTRIRFVVLARLPDSLPPLPDTLRASEDVLPALRYLCGGAESSETPLATHKQIPLLGNNGLLVKGAIVEIGCENENIFGIKDRVKRTEENIKRLRMRKEELALREASLNEELQKEQETGASLQNELSSLLDEIERLRMEKKRLQTEKEQTERRLDVIVSEESFKEEELTRCKGLLSESEKRLEEIEDEQKRLRTEWVRLDGVLNELRNVRLIKLQNEEAETSIEKARLEEKLTAKETEFRRLENALRGADGRNREAERLLQERLEQRENIKKEIEEEERKKKETLDRIAVLLKQKDELSASLSRLQNNDEQKEKLRKELYDAVEKATREEQQLALKETALNEQLQALLRNAEETGLNTEVGKSPEIESSEEELKKEIEDCERKVQALGWINQTAVEELRVVDGRLSFFMEQQAEVKRAIRRLRDTISELDSICRSRLQEIFDEVREHFNSLFRRLFGGGRAELLFTSDNILESGLEVMARPPGKMNTTISLLSGGERAMCAVALLFAIYSTRPSPICILDELDANLDDTNIASFVSLLREYSKTTQFIVITHSKQTISGIDDAIGVTMATPGITEIVSVCLKEAAEMVA